MTALHDDQIIVRPATAADDAGVLALLQTSLGWRGEGPDVALFRWKHRDNVFGPSPAWVADADGLIAGYRTFMRWEFLHGDRILRAVRAVDTATHPDFRGRGVFRRLTLAAVEAMEAEGVDLVFNTPNDQSRPGYLSMGWRVVGQLPVAMRPSGPIGAARAARARVPADLWSQPSPAGRPAVEVLSDDAALTSLLESQPRPAGAVTRRSPEYLRWRYGLPELHYRGLADADPAAGSLIFRLRRRGPATELAVVEVLTASSGAARRLVRRALHETGADYAVAVGTGLREGMMPLPGAGPVLTARSLASQLPSRWAMSLGDIELF